jgi:subtilisin family serine protease
MPAENTSPASEPLAITVGATNIRDDIASFSNYGKMVDIFAPGDQILSTWIHNNQLTRRLRGTSMASPHVAGAACCLLSDPNWTSERLNYNVISELLIRADKNTIQGLETKSRTIDAVLQTSD